MGRVFLVLLCVFALSGCITTKKTTDVTQLQMRVTQLEQKLEEQDAELKDLKFDVENFSSQAAYEPEPVPVAVPTQPVMPTTNISVSSNVDNSETIRVAATGQEVQTALKNAGYYTGTIDGKIGALSKKAISNFQRDHGLNSDGIVGRKTWTELQRYLQ